MPDTMIAQSGYLLRNENSLGKSFTIGVKTFPPPVVTGETVGQVEASPNPIRDRCTSNTTLYPSMKESPRINILPSMIPSL